MLERSSFDHSHNNRKDYARVYIQYLSLKVSYNSPIIRKVIISSWDKLFSAGYTCKGGAKSTWFQLKKH